MQTPLYQARFEAAVMADDFLATYQGADFQVLVNARAKALQKSVPSSPATLPSSNEQPLTASTQLAASTWKAGAVAQPRAEENPWRAWRSSRPPEPAGAPTASGAVAAPKPMPVAIQPAVAEATTPWRAAAPPMAPPPLFAGSSTVRPKAVPSSAQASLPKTAPPLAPEVFFPAKRLLEEKEAEVEYLKKRLHNSQRSGRNKVYYAMLNKYGRDVAAEYWVPPPEPASSSQDRVPKQAAAKVPEPKPKESRTGFRETL